MQQKKGNFTRNTRTGLSCGSTQTSYYHTTFTLNKISRGKEITRNHQEREENTRTGRKTGTSPRAKSIVSKNQQLRHQKSSLLLAAGFPAASGSKADEFGKVTVVNGLQKC